MQKKTKSSKGERNEEINSEEEEEKYEDEEEPEINVEVTKNVKIPIAIDQQNKRWLMEIFLRIHFLPITSMIH